MYYSSLRVESFVNIPNSEEAVQHVLVQWNFPEHTKSRSPLNSGTHVSLTLRYLYQVSQRTSCTCDRLFLLSLLQPDSSACGSERETCHPKAQVSAPGNTPSTLEIGSCLHYGDIQRFINLKWDENYVQT